MGVLLDKLTQRGIEKFGMPQQSPLPSYTANLSSPKTLTTTPLSERVVKMPARGAMGSTPQWKGTPQRFIADLPANVQLKGIQDILSGQDTQSPIINNFVRGLAAQGKQPEEIRQAFIAHQKSSPNPLVLA